MTYFLMEIMLITNKTNLCGCGGTADTLHLGCSAGRREGSNPFTRTIIINIWAFSSFFDFVGGFSWFSGNCFACPSQTDERNDEPSLRLSDPRVLEG